MTFLQSILMGLIQGLTEFLPVSSSGHLAIFKILFGVDTDTGLLFDVLLHVGTLIAVFAVYYKDIFKLIAEFVRMVADCIYNIRILLKRSEKRYKKIVSTSYRKFVVLIVVSTIPTGIIGYVGADLVTAASGTLIAPGICLLITGVILLISDRVPDGTKTPAQTTLANALIIGIFQGVATLPGISRSGFTIAACVFNGLDRRFAVKYSFILSIPAILGALVLELHDEIGNISATGAQIGSYVAGMAVAAFVGYICIKLMLAIVRNKKFKYFAFYCFAVGAVAIAGSFII